MRWAHVVRGLLTIAGLAAALEVELNEKPDNQQACQGMYSAKSWGGNVDPYLMATFLGYKDQGEVSYLPFSSSSSSPQPLDRLVT